MYSYSQIQLYRRCPRAWFCKYRAGLESVPSLAMNTGTALHRIAQMGTLSAGFEYLKKCSYIYNDEYINEEIKLGEQGYKLLQFMDTLPHLRRFEVEIKNGNFIGYADLICGGNLYDFKFTTKKRDGEQLSLYKYFTREDIKKMYYVYIPNTYIRQKKNESLSQYRRRLIKTLKEKGEVTCEEVKFKLEHIKNFKKTIKEIEKDKTWKQNLENCRWCSYKGRCNMIKLPENKRQKRQNTQNIKVWIYGSPYAGKTTLANTAEDPLFLNTDGNIKYIDAPAIAIKDHYKKQAGSRIVEKKAGWEIFSEVIETLATDPQGYKTVVVDLVEGVYELCRAYMLAKHGWEHESDDSFRAWDIVRTEFLNKMRALTNLNMNIILLSHEDASRDFTRRDGSKTSTIKPNISDKIAKQLAGMVDLTVRMATINGKRFLNSKTDETQFGGGRIDLKNNNIEVKKEDGWKTLTENL